MKLTLPKRTKIILLFLLGIGLPSLILGYLAFRGVQNDQALTEWQPDGDQADSVVDDDLAEAIARIWSDSLTTQ